MPLQYLICWHGFSDYTGILFEVTTFEVSVVASTTETLTTEPNLKFSSNRGWKLNNWITIIHYSLLFSTNLHYSFKNFPCFSRFIFQFLYRFSFSNSLSENYITTEVKTVILSRNLEIKQYMEFILSEIVYNSILWLSKVCISVYIQPYLKGTVSRNSAKLGNYKMPIKLRET